MRDGLLPLVLLLPLAAALPTGCAAPQRPPGPSVSRAVSPSTAPAATTVPDATASRPSAVDTLFGDDPAARTEPTAARVTSPASAAPARVLTPIRSEPRTESALGAGLKKLLNPFGAAPPRPRPLPRTDRDTPPDPSMPDGERVRAAPQPESAATQPPGFAF